MARGKATDDTVKAQVIASLLSGEGVNETARRYNLPPPTVSRIKAELGTELEQVGTEKRVLIDELLLKTMNGNLDALNRIAHASSEVEYVKKQPAECVAILYREIASVTIRLLEAATAAGVGESDSNGERTP